jgi:hypothetical protein
VTGVEFDGLGAHSLGSGAFKIGVDSAVLDAVASALPLPKVKSRRACPTANALVVGDLRTLNKTREPRVNRRNCTAA